MTDLPLLPLSDLLEDLPERFESRSGVELVELPVKQILNRCSNPRLPFRWTINPYRGCEFGCVYCYARYTHEFLGLNDPMDFERRILVKRKAAEALARSLARTPVGCDSIAIGTATDPYQPAERAFAVTRSILEIFARLGGLNLSVTTKSNLITRDIDLLASINERSRLSVNFSLITLNRRLQRILEPRAPRPALRLRALKELSSAGIRCNLLMMPLIPGLTDGEAAMERVIEIARVAGATQVWWRALFLKPSAARRFLSFIAREFPELKKRMDDFYRRSTYAPRAYHDRLGEIIERLKRKHGFATSEAVARPPPPKPTIQFSFLAS